ncbi:MAG: hypothetical protein EOO23_07680 [Comamonadaceae bacterium]|nr:MAG: hypothetical protein EOO23_07680 [Comamonadaceae bacterium]
MPSALLESYFWIRTYVSEAKCFVQPHAAIVRQRYPGIHVSLTDAAPDRALEQVRQRQADFALTARGPGMVGFQHRLLFSENFVLVCHRSHPLAKRKRLTLDDLAGQDYIRMVRHGSIQQHLEKFFRDIPINDIGLEVEQVSTVAGLVASNLGVCLIPGLAIPYFDRKVVVTVPIGGADLARPIYLVWRSAGVLSPAAQSFVDMLTIPGTAKG